MSFLPLKFFWVTPGENKVVGLAYLNPNYSMITNKPEPRNEDEEPTNHLTDIQFVASLLEESIPKNVLQEGIVLSERPVKLCKWIPSMCGLITGGNISALLLMFLRDCSMP